MKNLKKVLAMVLAFACTFTMFASAKVYEDVQPGTEFSEAITMLSDLGIIQGKTDNKYHPEDTITRAEACALIARLMTGDPNAAGFNGAHHFKDVPAGHWASSAIGYAVVNGIAVGVDQAGTKFEPNRPIKDKEFVTMIVRALGYETPDMRNNFPFGYMSAANAIGLLQDVNMVPDTDALRGEDAQVIYNAMFVDYARGAKRVNVAHGTTVEKYPTLAEDVWHLDRAAVGTWDKHDKDDETVKLSNCKAHTWVIVGQDGDDNILAYPIEDGNTEKDSHEIYESLENKVNGVKAAAYKFKYEGAADIDTLRGYKVELWGAGKHGEPSWEKKEGKYVFSNDWKIKAIKTIAGQTKFDYDASKADSKRDDGEIKVDDETTLKLGTAADNAQKVSEKNTSKTDRTTYLSKEEYNRENVTSDKKVEAALNVRDGAQYRLMDWDGDKEIDWVVVSEASYYKVEAVSSKRLTVTSMVDVTKNKKNEEDETESLTQTWKIGDDNEIFIGKDKKNSYKVKYEVPEGLKEGDIIEVAYSTGWDKITGTVSVVEPENHKLEKVATKNHLVLTFDGEVTELAENRNEADTIVPENPSKYIDFDEEELGREFAIAKNRNGFIIHSDYATEGGDYMMVLDTDDGSNKVRGELGAMKIITEDNKVLDNVEVVSDLMIDRKTSGNGYDKNSRHFSEDKVVGNVYRYWKDADGRITKMESMVDTATGVQELSYDYVAKNDRLTLNNKQSYALKDAKIIFAVKPHSFGESYIQHDGSNLKVDDADVLAVKQADIPDIGAKEDTQIAELDRAATKESWVKNTRDHNVTIAFDTNNNKDIKGAVLGVNSFNKFNAGSTKVGLVSNVAFDSNGVVSLDVATNGKTDTLTSAEKVKFEDIVSVKDYESDESVSVASRTETINVGIMKGSNLKDSLYRNGAYAEITTDKDGKLTGVLFMDNKTEQDGDIKGVNHGNVVVGNYYQVSRKVIADVKAGSWMSVVEGSALYADEDTFRSMDTKNTQKASDFASDANYYVIDGAPTRNDKDYTDTKATILDGFDGTPDVKVGEASDVVASEIRNNNNNGDRYNVADVATKIDAEGAGDVVAVYAYKDDMDETDAINMASVVVKDSTNTTVLNQVTPGQEVVITATVTDAHTLNNLNKINVYQNGTLIKTIEGDTEIESGIGGSTIVTKKWTVPATATGTLTFKAAYGTTEFGGGVKVKVDTADTKFVANHIEFAKLVSSKYVPSTTFEPIGKNSFAVHVDGETVEKIKRALSKGDVENLTANDFKVKLGNQTHTITKFESVKGQPGYYEITVADIDFSDTFTQELILSVELTGKNVEVHSGLTALTVKAKSGETAQGGDATGSGSTDTVTGVKHVAKVDAVDADKFHAVDPITEVKVKVRTADNKLVTGLETEKTNFTVKVAGKSTTDFTVDKVSDGVYKITKTGSETDLRGKTVEVTVNGKTATFNVPASKVEISVAADKNTLKAKAGKPATESTTITVKNADATKLKIWTSNGYAQGSTEVTDNATGVKVTLDTSAKTLTLSQTPANRGTFYVKLGVSDKEFITVTVDVALADAPTLASGLKDVKPNAGTEAKRAVPATSTYEVETANFDTDEDLNLTVNVADGQEVTVKVAAKTADNGNLANAAKAIRDALTAEVAKPDSILYGYNVGETGANVKLTAKEAVTGQKITLTPGSAKIGFKGASTKQTPGQAEKKAVAGSVEFIIPGNATDAEVGEWTLTVKSKAGDKTVKVMVLKGDTAAQVAKALERAIASTLKTDFTVAVDGTKVTLTEATSKEGTLIEASTQVTFTK